MKNIEFKEEIKNKTIIEFFVGSKDLSNTFIENGYNAYTNILNYYAKK